MMIRRWLSMALLFAFAQPSCQPEPTLAPKVELGPDEVARVGPWPITRSMLSAIDARPERAVSDLVSDSLLALEHKTRAPERYRVVERGTLARALVETLREEALRGAPPTPEEVARIVKDQWLRFDRPRAVRSVAVRVPVPDLADDTPYRDLAEELRSVARGAHNVETLLEHLSHVSTEYEVQRMRMPPVAADGRVVPQNALDQELTRVEPELAREAAALQAPGALSPVFALRDGYQFLFATEIIEPKSHDTQAEQEEIRLRVGYERIRATLDRITSNTAAVTRTHKDGAALLKTVWRQ